MARGFWVFRNGKVIPKEEADEVAVRTTIITDDMNPTVHPASGTYFTSKKKFREMTRAAGCVEVGDQKFDTPKPKEIGGEREALISTWNQLSERRK